MTEAILITGATSGIGKALTLWYARRGWLVWACGRSPERMQALVDYFPAHIKPLMFDLAEPQQLQQVLQPVLATGQLQRVILNAGTCEYVEQGELDPRLFARTFSINVQANVELIAALLPALKAAQGRIALLCSASSYCPLPRAEAYGASKSALRYLGHTLTASLAPYGIKVMTAVLGFVDTPMTAQNDFPMPMRISAERAATVIAKGLEAGKHEVQCPLLFCLFLQTMSWLPLKIQLAMAKKMVRTS